MRSFFTLGIAITLAFASGAQEAESTEDDAVAAFWSAIASDGPMPEPIASLQPDVPEEEEATGGIFATVQSGVESGFGAFNDWYYRILFYPVDHLPTLLGLSGTDPAIVKVKNLEVLGESVTLGEALDGYSGLGTKRWAAQDNVAASGKSVFFTGRMDDRKFVMQWDVGADGTISPMKYSVAPWSPPPPAQGNFPLILCLMVTGGVFFTFRYGWINIRLFRHAIDVVRGKFDHPDHPGEVSHFKALTSALSATVGLGNIGGVAVAITMGGPGAVFWMWVVALFGMSMKFSSCTFAQLYRRVKPDGTVLGGPMVYLKEGIKEKYPAFGWFGAIIAVLFAILTILASFGGGNMYQANQTYQMFVSNFFYEDGVLGEVDGALQVVPNPGEPLTVAVSPGEAAVVMRQVEVAEQSTTASIPVPTSQPRIDIVELETDGTISIRRGDEAESPVPPAPDRGTLALAYIHARPGMTAIAATDDGANGFIEDLRVTGSLDMPSAWVAFICGLFMAVPVGLVLFGGIKRIGEVTSRLVPAMCLFYCTVCVVILMVNAPAVPATFLNIFVQAFSPDAMFTGGFIGVLVQGMRRAAFSNEAGLGSAAIAHAAAKTDTPVREGVVAMLGPFIDTICVCTMTALAILVTNSHAINPALEGVQITALAFAQLGWFLPYFLMIAVFIFAFSTVVSWGYYGERSTEYLVGVKGIPVYRVVYIMMVVIGPMLSLSAVIDFSDFALLSMAFPNIIGMMLISGKVKKMADEYSRQLASGEMKPLQ